MDIQVAVLCDAATDYKGKLNLLGTFNSVYTKELPANYPQCSIVLRIVFKRVEEGEHKLRINFVDEDGKFVMPSIELPFDLLWDGHKVRQIGVSVNGFITLGPGQLCFALVDQAHAVRVVGDEPVIMYLSVTPHILPTHTGRTKEGEAKPVKFSSPASYDVEVD